MRRALPESSLRGITPHQRGGPSPPSLLAAIRLTRALLLPPLLHDIEEGEGRTEGEKHRHQPPSWSTVTFYSLRVTITSHSDVKKRKKEKKILILPSLEDEINPLQPLLITNTYPLPTHPPPSPSSPTGSAVTTLPWLFTFCPHAN